MIKNKTMDKIMARKEKEWKEKVNMESRSNNDSGVVKNNLQKKQKPLNFSL